MAMLDGYEDISTAYSTASTSDVVKYIPTVYRTSAALDSTKNMVVEFETSFTSSGTIYFQVEASLGPSGAHLGMFASGTSDINLDFTLEASDAVNIDFYTEFTYGTEYQWVLPFPVELFLVDPYTQSYDIINQLSFPYGLIDSFNNIISSFKVYKSITLYIDIINDLSIAQDKKFIAGLDVFSTLSGSLLNYYGTEATVGSGKLAYFDIDLHSSYLVETYLNNDIYSTASGTRSYYNVEAETATGTVTYVESDVYSTVSGAKGNLNCDVRTWSLNTGDFFLDVYDHTTASAIVWVDIVDGMYGVSISGSYFKVNGVPKYNVTFSGIDNGYRMFYDPLDDFYSVSGTITYTAHIENDVGDYRENNFYLLFGYNVAYKEVIDWGPNREVPIWMKAKNIAFCPGYSTDSYYYVTREYESRDLGAFIEPIGYVDLGSKIYPDNEFFFYGGTYIVTLSGIKDFSGNEMDTFRYTFTIEDPPS